MVFYRIFPVFSVGAMHMYALGGIRMYQSKTKRCGLVLLSVSICLRVCMLLGLDSRAAALLHDVTTGRETARWLLFWQTGQAAPAEQPEQTPEMIVLRYEQPQQQEPQTVPIEVRTVLSPEELAEAGEITVAGGCTYSFDKQALLDRPSGMVLSGDGPKILIVHTHSSEAYTQETGSTYESTAAYRTLDDSQSVIAVGDALARTLEAEGIEVLHDRSCNDYPSYNDAYWTTLQKIEDWKEQYPSIQMVIDLHRDAVEDASGNAVPLSSTQQGDSAAQLMLVVGTDQGGLSHPDWQENLANALKLQSVLQGRYPGLCRSIDLRTERFNQHMSPGSILVEVGTNGNTLRQALRSAELLGDGLADLLHTLERNDGVLCAPQDTPQ